MNNVLYSVLDKKYPVAQSAKGMYVYGTDGKRYLDCSSGIAVVNTGHGVEEILDAIKQQMDHICYVYGGTFTSEARERLAEQIIRISPQEMDQVFFCSGGSEAIESAIKIARQYQLERGTPNKYKVISRWQSYHGNTLGTLAIGGRPSWRQKYDPYLPGTPHIAPCNCYRCPFNVKYPECGLMCAHELERTIVYENPDTVSMFILEPIVGTTSAATVPPPGYMETIRQICDKYNVLLCVDEVLTGFGRTGKPFAIDHFGITPDLIAVAKGLGSGYTAIGAVIVHERIAQAIRQGTGELQHSFTFAASPLACAAASAVLDYYEKHDLFNRAEQSGKIFLEKLKVLERLDHVSQVRGVGLLLGVELVKDKKTGIPFEAHHKISKRIAEYCFDKGLIVTAGIPGSYDGISGEALQLAPPLIIEEDHMDDCVKILMESIEAVSRSLTNN